MIVTPIIIMRSFSATQSGVIPAGVRRAMTGRTARLIIPIKNQVDRIFDLTAMVIGDL